MATLGFLGFLLLHFSLSFVIGRFHYSDMRMTNYANVVITSFSKLLDSQ